MLLELDAPQGLRDSAGRIATEAATREWIGIERVAPGSAAAESRIESVGIALPEHEVTTAELVGGCRRAGRIDLQRLPGIRSRRVCSAGETITIPRRSSPSQRGRTSSGRTEAT